MSHSTHPSAADGEQSSASGTTASTEWLANVPGGPAVSPPANKRLLPSLLLSSLTLFATYGGLVSILLPTHVALIDEANKVANLAIVTTTSFIFTLLAQPIAGALSDRTRSKFGRRIPGCSSVRSWEASSSLASGPSRTPCWSPCSGWSSRLPRTSCKRL